MKGKERNRTRSGSDTKHEEPERRGYRYVQLVSESPHPLKKVPGIRRCNWWPEIGRWVKV